MRKEGNKMRKKLAVLFLVVVLFSSSTLVKADDIYKKTAYDLLQGGWTQRLIGIDGRHWTSYTLNSYPIQTEVIATIKVLGNPIETNPGNNYAKITSKYYVGPYVTHTHSYLIP